MKRTLLLMAILLSVGVLRLHAQSIVAIDWTMVVMEEGRAMPIIKKYNCHEKMADNGIVYQHIHSGNNFQLDNTATPYGCRFADKKIYIYDFKTQKETLAFDFNLSVGDHFTTFNGIEWEVESVKDTLVNVADSPFEPIKIEKSKRLLTVKNLDGKLSDQWLEDFGSFANHFMITSMENIVFSHTLWVHYDGYEDGNYIAREINADPIYAHDTGWMRSTETKSENCVTKCYFENGQVVFEDVQRLWECRAYSCFYRDGDELYRVYCTKLEPMIDDGELAWRKDVITFKGLPAPAGGSYTIHVNNNTYTTTATGVHGVNSFSLPSAGSAYDLQGRPVTKDSNHGIIIRNGRKVWQK